MTLWFYLKHIRSEQQTNRTLTPIFDAVNDFLIKINEKLWITTEQTHNTMFFN